MMYQFDELKIENSSSRAAHDQAKQLINDGKIAEGIYKLDCIINSDPRCLQAYFTKAQVFISCKNYSDAKRTLQSAMNICPTDPQPYMMLSDIFVSEGNNPSAVKILEKATMRCFKDPSSNSERDVLASIYCTIAQLHAADGRYGDAIDACDNAIASQPNFFLPYLYKGTLNLHLERFNDAKEDLTAARSRMPSDTPKDILRQIDGSIAQIEQRKKIQSKLVASDITVKVISTILGISIKNIYADDKAAAAGGSAVFAGMSMLGSKFWYWLKSTAHCCCPSEHGGCFLCTSEETVRTEREVVGLEVRNVEYVRETPTCHVAVDPVPEELKCGSAVPISTFTGFEKLITYGTQLGASAVAIAASYLFNDGNGGKIGAGVVNGIMFGIIGAMPYLVHGMRLCCRSKDVLGNDGDDSIKLPSVPVADKQKTQVLQNPQLQSPNLEPACQEASNNILSSNASQRSSMLSSSSEISRESISFREMLQNAPHENTIAIPQTVVHSESAAQNHKFEEQILESSSEPNLFSAYRSEKLKKTQPNAPIRQNRFSSDFGGFV